MTPAQVIQGLGDPATLLRHCFLMIAGGASHTGPNGQATISTFRVTVDNASQHRGFTTGLSGLLGLTKNRPKVSMTRIAGPAKAVLAADEFNAYYIPMVQPGDAVAGNSHYSLPTGGLDVAITSMLSGCVFSVGQNPGGGALASHIQPPTPANLNAAFATPQAEAVARGAMNMAPGYTQFRSGTDYNPGQGDRATIIGRRTGPTWRFYGQVSNRLGTPDQVRSAVEFVAV